MTPRLLLALLLVGGLGVLGQRRRCGNGGSALI